MANSEDIEARLCDYIEGELSPADQAEIERHLESHPRHRQMIQELIKTRRLVGALPRSKAPGDMTESLQGQLERAMLLGAGSIDAGTGGKVRHIARMAVMAAVVVLAISLGSGIYFMVHTASSGSSFAPMVAQSPPVPTPSISRSEIVIPTTQPTPKSDVALVADHSPSTRPDAPAAQPVLEKADLAILVNSTDQPFPQALVVVPATQPSTQPADDSAGSDDDSVAPGDDDR